MPADIATAGLELLRLNADPYFMSLMQRVPPPEGFLKIWLDVDQAYLLIAQHDGAPVTPELLDELRASLLDLKARSTGTFETFLPFVERALVALEGT